MHTRDMTPAHPGLQRMVSVSSEDGKQKSLHNCPGQTLHQVSGTVEAVRWTLSPSNLEKIFSTLELLYKNWRQGSKMALGLMDCSSAKECCYAAGGQ